jgi:hypothetical protein
VAAPERPAAGGRLNVAGQDVGPKDAPLPSLFPPEPKPPAPVCVCVYRWTKRRAALS